MNFSSSRRTAEDFINGDCQTSIEHLEFAIDQRENEDRFLALMSVSYLMSGNQETAQTWIRKVVAVVAAREDSSKKHYYNQLELLLGRDNQP